MVPSKEKKVCKPFKSLYRLKQSPKQWHTKFDHTVLANVLKINKCDKCDKCIYIKDTSNQKVIICLYEDDM